MIRLEVPLELSIARLQLAQPNKVETQLLQFHVFEGACRVVTEAQSGEDAS
jgi:hypothetical protein